MADLLGLSARFIDEGVYEGPGSVNRVTGELSEVAPGIAVIEAFSHVVSFASEDGLVVFDTSLEAFGETVAAGLRRWKPLPLHTIAYTHGHIDHVGGAAALVEDAGRRGDRAPRVVGHEALPDRFARYRLTNGYNAVINARQFGGSRNVGPIGAMGPGAGQAFGPARWIAPDTTFRDRLRLQVGELDLELRHAKGETDDHLWAWLPQRRAICAGDFVTWVFPNAGNPQKVQRYPLEWSAALREMAGLDAELLLPAHGLPVGGRDRVRRVLLDLAGALEFLVEQSLLRMNAGERLDALLHEVRLPDAVLDKPYLRPVYDEPEFVVRNVWRLYGGWYDGNPAHLKPAREAAVAAEVAALAGGAAALAKRAQEVAQAGDLRRACELVEWAGLAAPRDPAVHAVRAEVYLARRKQELSLMAKGVYADAARNSQAVADGDPPPS
ncbi:MAG: alkyl sulfatase dimerization domain-containing protein [Myxococcota bacterium]